MKFAIVVFPGSNCDRDCHHVVSSVCGQTAEYVWHKLDRLPSGTDVVILPGGFSYGDYLRAGAIARQSPIMKAVTNFAGTGGLVLGICNGFQILAEAGLLPGALMRNSSLKFECRDVWLHVDRMDTAFTCAFENPPRATAVSMPIAHMDGNYFADAATLARVKKNRQIVLRYCDKGGDVNNGANPNGSVGNIAGICNEDGNVFGLMPHPERCAEAALGGTDGRKIFESIIGAHVAPSTRQSRAEPPPHARRAR